MGINSIMGGFRRFLYRVQPVSHIRKRKARKEYQKRRKEYHAAAKEQEQSIRREMGYGEHEWSI